MQDRMRRELRAAAKQPQSAPVQFQRTAAEVPRETVPTGGLDNLQRSFQGFFNSVGSTFQAVRESELRTELQAIDRENAQLALEGKTLAEQGGALEDATEEQRSRYAFVNNYKQAVGARIFQTNDLETARTTLLEWDDQRGDPEGWIQSQLKEKTQGMDPIVAASYTLAFRKASDDALARNAALRREDASNNAVGSTLQHFSLRLSQGEVMGHDELETFSRTLERSLPPGKRSQARDLVNEQLFQFAERNPQSRYVQDFITNTRDASGLTLAERYPARWDQAKLRMVEREGRVLDPQEANELDQLSERLTVLKTQGANEENIQSLLTDLMDHKSRWGRGTARTGSDAWRGIYAQMGELLGRDANYRAFSARVEARVNGVPGAAFVTGNGDMWDRRVAELTARGVPFERMAVEFAANNTIPPLVRSQLSAGFTSEKDDDRVVAFNRARTLETAFDNNPAKLAEALGNEGMLAYSIMRNRVALTGLSEESIRAAASAARVVQNSGMRLEDVRLGEDSRQTAKFIDDADARVREATASWWQRRAPESWTGVARIELTGAARSELERISKNLMLVAKTRHGDVKPEEIQEAAARILMTQVTFERTGDRVQVALRTNNRFRRTEDGVDQAVTYTPAQLGQAWNDFSGVSRALPELAPLHALRPLQGGQGYQVYLKKPDESFETPVVVPMGSVFGGVQMPENIPSFGWQPAILQDTKYRFIQDPNNPRVAVLVYRGETVSEEARRMEIEEAVKMRQRVDEQRQTDERRRELGIGSEIPDVNPSAEPEDPNVARMSPRYWLNKWGENLARGLASGGYLQMGDTTHRKPVRLIENERDLMAHLENLMNEAGVSARFTPSRGNPNNVYDTQRYDFIAKVEGVRYAAYDDATGRKVSPGSNVTGNRTIGIGFNMERPDARQVFRDVLNIPEKDFNDYYTGKKVLSNAHVRTLFNFNADEAEKIVENRIGKDIVDKLSRQQRLVLVSLAFNNPSLIGPNLTAAIRENRLEDAAREIRERSNRARNPGIQSRRELEADTFLNVG